MAQGLSEWGLSRLEAVADEPRVVVRDPLRLLPDAAQVGDAPGLHDFASAHAFTVIVAATNLVFRDLYERAVAAPETRKLLVVDRSPAPRGGQRPGAFAPPPFYPDLLSQTTRRARVELALRQYLVEATGDPEWPAMADSPRYARLISRHLDGVLRAHQNLRAAHPTRFTDADFQTIVAYAALGLAGSAFKTLRPRDYWQVGLLRHEALRELDMLAPEVTRPVHGALRKAPAPFCWFADHDSDTVLRAFYLSLLLAQHGDNWQLLLANVDAALQPLSTIKLDVLRDAAPQLIALDPSQAQHDLQTVEEGLDAAALKFVLLDQLQVEAPAGFAALLERERYSVLFRSVALLFALDDLLSAAPSAAEQDRVTGVLFGAAGVDEGRFVDGRPSATWSSLKEAYHLARDIQSLRHVLAAGLKQLGVLKTEALDFAFFWYLWNTQRVNRLEYFLSALDRLAESGELLPRPDAELPAACASAVGRIRRRVQAIADEVKQGLDEANRRFQALVETRYPDWVARDTEIHLTSQFIRRCLKPHWDPQHEQAAIFIFDGMRYDIWDELLKPVLLDRMEILEDLPASAILPSETHVTRKAISAGTYPDEFDTSAAENALLLQALRREMGYNGHLSTVNPDSAGTAETIRYEGKNLKVFIYELCDKELHGVGVREFGNRLVPSRPLSFIYRQHVKNILDTEVAAIMRRLAPGTKVFITADHGFGPVGRTALWFDDGDLNEPGDCKYLNARLRVPAQQATLWSKPQGYPVAFTPEQAREKIITFTPEQVRLPKKETKQDRPSRRSGGPAVEKEYRAIAFPRVGHAFSRNGSPFHPDAYSHGGISIQEMMIPMVVLRVKARDEGVLTLDAIKGPSEVVEGQEAEFRLRLSHTAGSGAEDLRVEVDATYARRDVPPLSRQVLYVSHGGIDAVYRFVPDTADASDDERRAGVMERTLTITAAYVDGRRTVRKSQTHPFAVRLNADQVVRRVGNLGSLLGLMPKSMRG